jgi:hypothetical protein
MVWMISYLLPVDSAVFILKQAMLPVYYTAKLGF